MEAALHRAEIESDFRTAASTPSDINEHVPILRVLALQCFDVCEFGVRSGVSTLGCLLGLLDAAEARHIATTLHGFDLSPHPAIYERASRDGVQTTVPGASVTVSFTQGSVLDVPPVSCDMLFIDTFHVYGQLKRELARHAAGVRRFIVMHDTTVDAVRGEALRLNMDPYAASVSTGIPVGEIIRGLWPAIEEFVASSQGEWRITHRLVNNNGLTVLTRRGCSAPAL